MISGEARFQTTLAESESFKSQMALLGLDVPDTSRGNISLTGLIASLNALDQAMSESVAGAAGDAASTAGSAGDTVSTGAQAVSPTDWLDTLFKSIGLKDNAAERLSGTTGTAGQSETIGAFSEEGISSAFENQIVSGKALSESNDSTVLKSSASLTKDGNMSAASDVSGTGQNGEAAENSTRMKSDPAYSEFASLDSARTAADAGNLKSAADGIASAAQVKTQGANTSLVNTASDDTQSLFPACDRIQAPMPLLQKRHKVPLKNFLHM